MKTLKKIKTRLLLIGSGVLMITISSCTKDSPLNPLGNCFDGNWLETYANGLQTMSNAATTYSNDPTPANCSNYKNATKAYLDAAADFYDCIPAGDKSEIDQELKEAKAEIDKEGCDNL